MSVEQVSEGSDSVFSFSEEVVEVPEEEKAYVSIPRGSQEAIEKAQAEAVYQENLRTIMALPPRIQEEREKNAIRNDSRLKELIGNETILDIVKAEEGYVVVTETHRVEVKVIYLPIDYCGPAEFELEFGDVKPGFILT